MRVFRSIWLLHRWLGITAGLVLILTSITGLLLLVKKDYAWIQPETMKCAEGTAADLQPMVKVYEAVFALGLPQFRTEDDIAKVDFRPGERLHKVISKHDDMEVQVCAITLRTEGPNERRSDWLERLHDGSWFGDFAHDRVMPIIALILLFLASSGYVMWLYPKWKKWRKQRYTSTRNCDRRTEPASHRR